MRTERRKPVSRPPNPGDVTVLQATALGRPRVQYQWFYAGKEMPSGTHCEEPVSGTANDTQGFAIVCTLNKTKGSVHDGNYYVQIKQAGGNMVQSTGRDVDTNYVSDVALLNKPGENADPATRVQTICQSDSRPTADTTWIRLETNRAGEVGELNAPQSALSEMQQCYGAIGNARVNRSAYQANPIRFSITEARDGLIAMNDATNHAPVCGDLSLQKIQFWDITWNCNPRLCRSCKQGVLQHVSRQSVHQRFVGPPAVGTHQSLPMASAKAGLVGSIAYHSNSPFCVVNNTGLAMVGRNESAAHRMQDKQLY